MCGGTRRGQPARFRCPGLSPRVRGNLDSQRLLGIGRGSIPACAGEPWRPAATAARRVVYPRVCGGTALELGQGADTRGLSPRVRGNPPDTASNPPQYRSIPACAGEPQRSIAVGSGFRGLSPRVRGNRMPSSTESGAAGSIPACAGEPPASPPRVQSSRVYPRVCGGTLQLPEGWPSCKGLSPRVRGNPVQNTRRSSTIRSIPACAGEPSRHCDNGGSAKVYPRVCGGTRCSQTKPRFLRGLSPRVRGNPQRRHSRPPETRSIPACAGEPR